MVRRILEDNEQFRQIVKGKIRKELSRLTKNGGFVRRRSNGSTIRVSISGIEQPFFVHGSDGEGVGRGDGKKGQVVGKEPGVGKKEGGGEEGHEGGITVGIDLDEFLKVLQEELELPDLKPKPNNTFDEIKIKYNSISKVGPESLRHTRRTITECLKRMSSSGDLDDIYNNPDKGMPLLMPINADRRYRQYKEEIIPSSNALVFFARDYSGSMDDTRCEIVSDMCWWIDLWIQKSYAKTEKVYIIHDTEANEVAKQSFYSTRNGGGTVCSSPFKLISEYLENRYNPNSYNIYIFYFTDGDNWGDNDNAKIIEMLQNSLGPNIINMVGITEVLPWSYDYGFNTNPTLKSYIDEELKVSNGLATRNGFEHVRTTSISHNGDRDEQVMLAIKNIIGKERVYS